MLAGIWLQLRHTTQLTNWSSLFSSGLWLRSFMNISMGEPLTSTPTTGQLMSISTTKMDAACYQWMASLADYNFQLHYRAQKTNVNMNALSRVSRPRCMTDTMGIYYWVTATAVWAVQEATLKGLMTPIGAYSCDVYALDPIEGSWLVSCVTSKRLATDPGSQPHPERGDHEYSGWDLRPVPILVDGPGQLLREHNHLKLKKPVLKSDAKRVSGGPMQFGTTNHTQEDHSEKGSMMKLAT